MKKLILVFFVLLAVNMKAQSNLKVKANVLNPPTNQITVESFGQTDFKMQKVEVKDNKFEFEANINQLEFLKLSFDNNSFVVLVVLPGEKIEMSFDMKFLIETITIKGSKHSNLIYDNDKKLLPYLSSAKRIVDEFNQLTAAGPDIILQSKYQAMLDSVKRLEELEIIKLVNLHFASPAVLFVVERLELEKHSSLFIKVSDELSKKYTEHPIIKQFAQRVKSVTSTAIGSKAPDLKMQSINGDSLSLYPIKGELVLIDFWASWCSPCRKSNPSKVQLYNKYKDKGLVIFSVSLDQKEDGWKNAIISDKLDWPLHVSDLKGWQSDAAKTYGVSSIPANLIIDKNGKILAKNIRGEELDKFIFEFFYNK